MTSKRILFILKKNESYAAFGKRSGLYNSTRFVSDALVAKGFESKVVEIVDNNSIDREVALYKPNIAIVEALWVVPEKFDVLKKLHPKVKWFVHLHSNIPFLAVEGIAVQWMREYVKHGVGLIVNSVSAYEAVKELVGKIHTTLAHNVYPTDGFKKFTRNPVYNNLRVGCFGAIRPMKNQLTQALAACKFATENKLELDFCINSTRSETGGDPVLKNLRALFEPTNDQLRLVEMPWMEHADFLTTLPTMDICMQVSLSETFNIVTADAVASGVPVVVSNEIDWVIDTCQVGTDSVNDIAEKMADVYNSRFLVWRNQSALKTYSTKAQKEWVNFITNQ